MDAADFIDDENWDGGYYELAIDLGPKEDPASTNRLREALAATWANDRLHGCYLDRWQTRTSQTPIAPELTEDEHPASLYGTALLPSGAQVVCVTHIVRESNEQEHRPHDWLNLCLPVGALGRVDHRVGGFPAEQPDSSLEWRRPIDAWLVEIAQQVFTVAGFECAMVDWEVSGVGLPADRSEYKGTYLLGGPSGATTHLATA